MPASLSDKIVALHGTLKAAEIPHAFGGALALAWCTQRARGTIDIDLNLFMPVDQAAETVEAMPIEVSWSQKDVDELRREGQVRLWWDKTPIDLFLNTLDLHKHMARRARWEEFAGHSIPFLACQDLAILKVFFNRTKDWADLEEMLAAGTLDVPIVMATIIEYLGANDERVAKLEQLAGPAPDPSQPG